MFFLFRLFSSFLLLLACLWDVRAGGFFSGLLRLFVCVVFAVLVVVFAVRSSGLEIPIFTYLVLFFPGVGHVAEWRVPESLKVTPLAKFRQAQPESTTNQPRLLPAKLRNIKRSGSIHPPAHILYKK